MKKDKKGRKRKKKDKYLRTRINDF